MKIQLVLFLCIIVSVCYGQVHKYALSDPTDLEPVGWNKVLCMKNGNTMLFHFEVNKQIVVKVFDSLHKEVASQKFSGRYLDQSKFKATFFEGLFEVNGEATLFMTQEREAKFSLLRLRFNGNDGHLTEEKILAESPSASRRTDFRVVNNKSANGYSIVYCTDDVNFKKIDLHVTLYDQSHAVIKDLPLEIDRKSCDEVEVIGTDAAKNGVNVSLRLSTKELNGTKHANGSLGTPDLERSTVATFFIDYAGSKARTTQLVDLGVDLDPVMTFYTYNPYAEANNVLLLTYRGLMSQNGLEWLPVSQIAQLLLKVGAADMGMTHAWVKNTEANNYLHKNTDSSQSFIAVPAAVFTNENGLSTVVMESVTRAVDKDPIIRARSYLGNIGITQYDDDGKEIWGIVLPHMQCYRGYFPITDIIKKNQIQPIFWERPEQVYPAQFCSINSYCKDRNYYVLFNEQPENMNNTLKSPGDTVYAAESANACYYKLNRKKEVTKDYLFGVPAKGDNVSSMIDGACFDEQRGIYATLVQCKKGDEITLRMGWAKLD